MSTEEQGAIVTIVESNACEGCLRNDESVNAAPFPVLRIRADGPTAWDMQEISIDGVPLRDVVSVELRLHANEVTRATIVMEVTPDIDAPLLPDVRRP